MDIKLGVDRPNKKVLIGIGYAKTAGSVPAHLTTWEVIGWVALSKNEERRCANTSTANCWLAHGISGAKANNAAKSTVASIRTATVLFVGAMTYTARRGLRRAETGLFLQSCYLR